MAGGGGSQYPIPKIIYPKYPVSLSFFLLLFFFSYIPKLFLDKYPVFQYKCQISQNKSPYQHHCPHRKNELSCIDRNSLESKQFDFLMLILKHMPYLDNLVHVYYNVTKMIFFFFFFFFFFVFVLISKTDGKRFEQLIIIPSKKTLMVP